MERVVYMSQEYVSRWKRFWSGVCKLIFIFFLTFGIFGFWVAYHNLDLLHNYAMIYNEMNLEYFCDGFCLDIKEIKDCTGFGNCPDYQTIYLYSNLLLYFSYSALVIIIVALLEMIFRKRKNGL